MAEILSGKPVSRAIGEEITQKVAALTLKGIVPTLAVVRVGENPDDLAYENSIVKKGEKYGAAVRILALPKDATQQEILETIESVNRDASVHGCLLFRPLPKHLNTREICDALAPEKDVDGITESSLSGLFTGSETGFAPCTPSACIEMLDYYGIDPKGKNAVVIGRSLVVGKPLAMMLLKKNATVTICHTKTENLPEICRKAELLCCCAGRPKMVGKDHVSPQTILLDVGINADENGSLCGDADEEAVSPVVKVYTPVPGGIGTVTTAVLFKHLVTAAERSLTHD